MHDETGKSLNNTPGDSQEFTPAESFEPVKLNVSEGLDTGDLDISNLFGDKDYNEVNTFVYEKENQSSNSILANNILLEKAGLNKLNPKARKKLVLITGLSLVLFGSATIIKSLLSSDSELEQYQANAAVIKDVMQQNIVHKTANLKKELDNAEQKVAVVTTTEKDGAKIYQVQKGDTLAGIAKAMNVSEEIIKTINTLESDQDLKTKQTLIIPMTKGIIHTVSYNETLDTISRKYKIALDKIIEANKTNVKNPHFLNLKQKIFIPGVDKVIDTPVKVTNKGSVYQIRPGETLGHIAMRFGVSVRSIMIANNIHNPELLQIGQKIYIPPNSGSRGRLSNRSVSADGYNYGYMLWPTSDGQISSNYGWRWGRMHHGVDIAAPYGQAIKASMAGKVSYSGWASGYGYLVELEHFNGMVTRYAHCSRLYVRSGQNVSFGQVIAAVGSTGRSTGPHLHYEVLVKGQSVNPDKFF